MVEFAERVVRRLYPDAIDITATSLTGGVSSDCFVVRWNSSAVVVKRALGSLKVDVDWQADPERIFAEAEALAFLGRITPRNVPHVLGVDRAEQAMVIELAPEDMVEWRQELLSGAVNPTVGNQLGAILASWHNAAEVLPPLIESGKDRLWDLRVKPFHLDMASRWPDFSTKFRDLADSLMDSSECFVHGDFSPKNILHGSSGLWVLDAEVAHRGNPVLDLAFLLAHLFIKATHVTAKSELIHETMQRFLTEYRKFRPLPDRLQEHIGTILAVRIDGVSRVRYLNEDSQNAIRQLSKDLLSGSSFGGLL